MRRVWICLLAALCALQTIVGACAEETTFTVVVPSAHVLTITCGAHGHVTADGKEYSGTFTLSVPRLGGLTLTLVPDAGYRLLRTASAHVRMKCVWRNTITLSSIYEDKATYLALLRRRLPARTALCERRN